MLFHSSLPLPGTREGGPTSRNIQGCPWRCGSGRLAAPTGVVDEPNLHQFERVASGVRIYTLLT